MDMKLRLIKAKRNTTDLMNKLDRMDQKSSNWSWILEVMTVFRLSFISAELKRLFNI